MKLVTKKFVATLALSTLVAGALLTGTSSGSSSGAGKRQAVAATVVNAAGSTLGTVRFVTMDSDTVRVTARLSGLTEGFHGFHVHTTGVCDPAAKDTSGNTVPFFSAGGHYNPTVSTHGDHAGDMPPLLVQGDGTAMLRFKTDSFQTSDLLDDDGSAVMVHAGPDNLAHIPPTSSTGAERYHSHVDNVFGADSLTKATGDAGARFACGVIQND